MHNLYNLTGGNANSFMNETRQKYCHGVNRESMLLWFDYNYCVEDVLHIIK